MIRLSAHGLFLTCELFFLFCTHIHRLKQVRICLKGKLSYLERRSLVHGGKFPSSQVPCLKWTALALLTLPSPPRIRFPPTEHLFYKQTTLTSPMLLSDTIYVFHSESRAYDRSTPPSDGYFVFACAYLGHIWASKNGEGVQGGHPLICILASTKLNQARTCPLKWLS
jgi:hypothetical protein